MARGETFALRAVIASRYCGGGGIVSFFFTAAAGAYFDLAFVANVAREALAVVASFVGLEVGQGGEVGGGEFGGTGDAGGAVLAVEGRDLGAGRVGGGAPGAWGGGCGGG
jgi:hypothetical protein